MEGFAETIADHGAWQFEPAGGDVRWSTAMYEIHGVEHSAFVPTPERIRALIHPDDQESLAGSVRAALAAKASFACQYRVKTPAGDERIIAVRGSFVAASDGAGGCLAGTAQDVTGRDGEEERLWHLANHDSLSGLFNRRRFMEELERELAAASRRDTPGALLMLDLDRFKDINDSLGHMAGDSLLVRVAGALRDRLRDTDTLARLGGDEFAVILPECGPVQAERVASDLLESLRLSATVRIGGVERPVSGSIGIAGFDSDRARTADELLVEADLAMYRAKTTGGGGVAVFDAEMRAKLAERISTEGELGDALGGQQLRVQYQPVVALADGSVVGCEALVRWEHPLRGMVGPNEFVPIAEETGLISRIGRFVLERACRQAADWRFSGRNLYVSVNLSPLQLASADIVDDVAHALEASGLPAELLCLEITETSLLNDSSSVLTRLGRLKALGVRIALDDFGGSASSLGLLRLLPVDVIKIDRLFIDGIADHANDRAIVAAVVSLAAELELEVVAEGVETERQQGELRDLGATLAQGFLYSRARYPEDLELGGFPAPAAGQAGGASALRGLMRRVGIPARSDAAG